VLLAWIGSGAPPNKVRAPAGDAHHPLNRRFVQQCPHQRAADVARGARDRDSQALSFLRIRPGCLALGLPLPRRPNAACESAGPKPFASISRLRTSLNHARTAVASIKRGRRRTNATGSRRRPRPTGSWTSGPPSNLRPGPAAPSVSACERSTRAVRRSESRR
jgi:hypothetical protein